MTSMMLSQSGTPFLSVYLPVIDVFFPFIPAFPTHDSAEYLCRHHPYKVRYGRHAQNRLCPICTCCLFPILFLYGKVWQGQTGHILFCARLTFRSPDFACHKSGRVPVCLSRQTFSNPPKPAYPHFYKQTFSIYKTI